MSYMSIRDLNANVSRALAQAETGEDIVLTRNGKPVLRITREGVHDREAKRLEAIERMRARMAAGFPGLHGPATYEERTEG